MPSQTALADDQTMSAIRAMMTEPVEPVAPVPKIEAAPQFKVAPSSTLPKDAGDRETKTQSAINWQALRPGRKALIWALIVGLIILRPHMFVIGFVAVLFIIGGSFAIFGSDRVWHTAMRGFERYARVAPNRAERFARRMDRFALRWDAVLDRFPDGAVDGLYLPDFQSMSKADERHAAIMDERLARMQAGT